MLNYLWWYIIFAFIYYVLGSYDFAVFFSRFCGVNINKEGSKNPGTLNTFRCCGFKAGSLTFICDALKGTLCALIGLFTLGASGAFYGMLFCNIGHIFPMFQKFKGGKGIAVTFGAMFTVNYILALSCLILLIIYLLLFEHGALGTVICVTVFTIAESVFCFPEILALISLILNFILVIIRHIPNIKASKNSTDNLFMLKKRKLH